MKKPEETPSGFQAVENPLWGFSTVFCSLKTGESFLWFCELQTIELDCHAAGASLGDEGRRQRINVELCLRHGLLQNVPGQFRLVPGTCVGDLYLPALAHTCLLQGFADIL